MSKNVTIVGGHGNVALRLARRLSLSPHGYSLTSIIRDPSQSLAITSAGATPLVLSLEHSPVSDFVNAFKNQDVIVFSAGAGGKGGEERTKQVDYEGAVKVFDAIDAIESESKPRLILISGLNAIEEGRVPDHYNDQDKAISDQTFKLIPAYLKWKYEADKNLVQRTAFKWTILRPGQLTNEPGTGKASIGRTHLSPPIPRDDVANILALLVEREDTGGLTIDVIGGETPIEEGLDAFVKKGETDFLGNVTQWTTLEELKNLESRKHAKSLVLGNYPSSYGSPSTFFSATIAPVITFLITTTTVYMGKKITIVGGHGNVALRLARLLSQSSHDYTVTSIIRDPAHAADISSTKATPLVLSLELSPVSEFTSAFQGQDVVVFSAGAGGKGGEERTKKVDYEGALKVFDAVEAVDGERPRLLLVSAVDIRDEEKIPEHYNDQDKAMSERIRKVIPVYMKWKYEADKNLSKRTAFKWTILRPGGLTNEPGTGKASIGRTHLSPQISRDDVAQVLALLIEREDAAGLGIDLVGGETSLEEGLDAFIKKGETDFLG
ncbi:hypothetical protein NP233_g11043 [Leucocoprinus birnbaumii]|uniref:NAD(P)-binding domain-containing protein n=1 Tax=Leucocoprinus birnbaumii TaxID=56174 RepID=A0AAD5VH59_9AGAR|nr:hypothetical protein NP233_g11043 [Leucocoprinus birnbaumii]